MKRVFNFIHNPKLAHILVSVVGTVQYIHTLEIYHHQFIKIRRTHTDREEVYHDQKSRKTHTGGIPRSEVHTNTHWRCTTMRSPYKHTDTHTLDINHPIRSMLAIRTLCTETWPLVTSSSLQTSKSRFVIIVY